MRRFLLLALGVLCGALAVSGQEREGDALGREIDRMKKLLEARIAELAQPAEDQLVIRNYDVADLRAEIRDRLQPLEDLWPSSYQPPEPEAAPELRCCFEIDTLIEMIKFGVEPESWEMEGADISPKNGRLFIRAIPRVHGKIERNLAWCREAMDRRVSIEIAAVPVAEADAALLAGAIELSAEEAQRLLAHPKGALALSGWDGQILGGRAGREIAYVQDIDVEMADGKAVPDPITHRVFAGCSAQVQACIDEGKGAIVDCRLEFSTIPEPLPTHPTPHGNIELPRKQLTRVMATFWAPLGTTVVAGGSTVGDEPCAILVTVRQK